MARKRLGEMLLDARLIDEDGLRVALAEQKRHGGPLGRFFIELGLVTEDHLVQVLSKQLTMAVVDLSRIAVAPAVLALVPGEFANNNGVLPFAQPMKFLDVAMIDPTNQATIDALRVMTKLNIRPHLCGPRALEKAIGRLYNIGVTTARLTSGSAGAFAAARGETGWSDSFPAEETSSFEIMHSDGTKTKASRNGPQRVAPVAATAGIAEPVARKPPRTKQPSGPHGIDGLDLELGIDGDAAAAVEPPQRAEPAHAPHHAPLAPTAPAATPARAAIPPAPPRQTHAASIPPPPPPAPPHADEMIERLTAAVHQLAAQLADVTAKQERDEAVLRALLGLIVEKGLCTREELQAWLAGAA